VNEDFNDNVGTVNAMIRLLGIVGVITSTAMDTDSMICVRRITFGYLRRSVAAQSDSQDELDITRWQDTHPAKSHNH